VTHILILDGMLSLEEVVHESAEIEHLSLLGASLVEEHLRWQNEQIVSPIVFLLQYLVHDMHIVLERFVEHLAETLNELVPREVEK
jgi:hypothetical protein